MCSENLKTHFFEVNIKTSRYVLEISIINGQRAQIRRSTFWNGRNSAHGMTDQITMLSMIFCIFVTFHEMQRQSLP